jgi:hypothetical protein
MAEFTLEAQCKHCGCTESRACQIEGEGCYWVIFRGQTRETMNQTGLLDFADNVCSNPSCVEKEYRALAAESNRTAEALRR